MELGYVRTELRRKLVDAVLRGEKTATAGLRVDYEPHTKEPLPQIGDRTLLLGFDDEPLAVIETTDVDVVRAGDVDLAFARDREKASRASPTGAGLTKSSGPNVSPTNR